MPLPRLNHVCISRFAAAARASIRCSFSSLVNAYEATRERVISYLPKNAVGAEIGVWRGDFSARIIAGAQPKVLHLIDPWLHAEGGSHANSLYGRSSQDQMDEIHDHVRARFAKHIDEGNVLIHRGSSEAILSSMEDDCLDYIYIDGDHAYDGVRKDIELAYRVVRPGGLICLDDHYLGRWWEDGIVRAVNEFLGRYPRNLQLAFMSDGQVMIRRRR